MGKEWIDSISSYVPVACIQPEADVANTAGKTKHIRHATRQLPIPDTPAKKRLDYNAPYRFFLPMNAKYSSHEP